MERGVPMRIRTSQEYRIVLQSTYLTANPVARSDRACKGGEGESVGRGVLDSVMVDTHGDESIYRPQYPTHDRRVAYIAST